MWCEVARGAGVREVGVGVRGWRGSTVVGEVEDIAPTDGVSALLLVDPLVEHTRALAARLYPGGHDIEWVFLWCCVRRVVVSHGAAETTTAVVSVVRCGCMRAHTHQMCKAGVEGVVLGA